MIKNAFKFLVCAVGLLAAVDASAQASSPRRTLLNRNIGRGTAPAAAPAEAAAAPAATGGSSDTAAEEPKEAPALNFADAQHVLNQRPRLHRKDCVHLLQG